MLIIVYEQSKSLSVFRKHIMNCHGLVQCYFPWNAQRYLQPSISFYKKLGPRWEHIIVQAFCES